MPKQGKLKQKQLLIDLAKRIILIDLARGSMLIDLAKDIINRYRYLVIKKMITGLIIKLRKL